MSQPVKPIEPPSIETAPVYLIEVIARLLEYIIKENGKVEWEPQTSPFTTDWKYDWVEIGDYMDRLKEWIVCGAESFVVATCYFKRLEIIGALPVVSSLSVHRIFFTCLMLAVKMVEDETLNNADFAKVACIQLKDLNEMEVYVLIAMNFNCSIAVEEFVACKRELIHLDLLLMKAKTGEVPELKGLGRCQGSNAALFISTIASDLSGIPAKRLFASTIPRMKENRRNSHNVTPQATEVHTTPGQSGLGKKIPSYLPRFMKRRISFEAFRLRSRSSSTSEQAPNHPPEHP